MAAVLNTVCVAPAAARVALRPAKASKASSLRITNGSRVQMMQVCEEERGGERKAAPKVWL